jgi:hypothetical protein
MKAMELAVAQEDSCCKIPIALIDRGCECNRLWLLKNSYRRNSQKQNRVRKPYKRLSRVAKTFSIPQLWLIVSKSEFFNSHTWFRQRSGTV